MRADTFHLGREFFAVQSISRRALSLPSNPLSKSHTAHFRKVVARGNLTAKSFAETSIARSESLVSPVIRSANFLSAVVAKWKVQRDSRSLSTPPSAGEVPACDGWSGGEDARREKREHLPLFTLATGSKFLFITATQLLRRALKDYFQPSLFVFNPACVPPRLQCRRSVWRRRGIRRAFGMIKHRAPFDLLAPLSFSGLEILGRRWRNVVEDLKSRPGKIFGKLDSRIRIRFEYSLPLCRCASLFLLSSLFNCFNQELV